MAYSSILLVLSWTAVFCNGQGSFLLTTSTTKVEIGVTTRFYLYCSYWGDGALSTLRNVTLVRILRENENGTFALLAERDDSGAMSVSNILDTQCMVTGRVSDVANTYLKLLWPVATAETSGKFRCDVTGTDDAQIQVDESSPAIVISLVNITASGVLSMLTGEIKATKDYCDTRVSEVEGNLTVLASQLGNTSLGSSSCSQGSCPDDVKDLLRNQTEELNILREELASFRQNQSQCHGLAAELNALKDKVAQHGEVKFWPEGSYGLVMPESGCPSNSRTLWDSGYRKFVTGSRSNNVEPHSHLKKPTLETTPSGDFLYLHFCVTSSRSSGGPWPRGSYCIHSMGACPPNFQSGDVYVSGDSNRPLSTINGTLPTINVGTDYTQLFYCCRSDGPTNVAIYLPSADPFYLYRYKGTCQSIEDRRVEPEQVVMDTDFINHNLFDFFSNDVHPDGSTNNWVFELCYYY